MAPRVLIIEPEVSGGGNLASWLKRHGCHIQEAYDRIDAERVLREQDMDVLVAVLDDCGPDSLGFLRKLREISHDAAFILLTRPQNIRLSMEGMKLGALDAMPLPVDMDLLLTRIVNASSHRKDPSASDPAALATSAAAPFDPLTGSWRRLD